jgi:hypothetical protein
LGGATKWLSKYSEQVITVDVNEFVRRACKDYSNVEAWNCSTSEAATKIQQQNLKFDLAVVDADHSRKAVKADIEGLLDCTEVILMHDSFNPDCRRGMLDALEHQSSHAYNLDFVSSNLKHDGLWGGFGIAWRSEKTGRCMEFQDESSCFSLLALKSLFQFRRQFNLIRKYCKDFLNTLRNKIGVMRGKILNR